MITDVGGPLSTRAVLDPVSGSPLSSGRRNFNSVGHSFKYLSVKDREGENGGSSGRAMAMDLKDLGLKPVVSYAFFSLNSHLIN